MIYQDEILLSDSANYGGDWNKASSEAHAILRAFKFATGDLSGAPRIFVEYKNGAYVARENLEYAGGGEWRKFKQWFNERNA